MAETASWLEVEVPRFTRTFLFKTHALTGSLSTAGHLIKDFVVRDCTLSWKDQVALQGKDYVGLNMPQRETHEDYILEVRVALKDLDTGAFALRTEELLPGEKIVGEAPIYLAMTTRGSVGRTIINQRSGLEETKSSGAGFHVDTRENADRVANAVRRAAVLCGAPVSPF